MFSDTDFFRLLKNEEGFLTSGGCIASGGGCEASSNGAGFATLYGVGKPSRLLARVPEVVLGGRSGGACVSACVDTGPLEDPNTLLKKPGRSFADSFTAVGASSLCAIRGSEYCRCGLGFLDRRNVGIGCIGT